MHMFNEMHKFIARNARTLFISIFERILIAHYVSWVGLIPHPNTPSTRRYPIPSVYRYEIARPLNNSRDNHDNTQRKYASSHSNLQATNPFTSQSYPSMNSPAHTKVATAAIFLFTCCAPKSLPYDN